MSLSYRHRTGLLLAGLMIGAPLLAAGTAHAGTPSITFSGDPLLGLSTLSCASTPSQTTLTVAPGTVVDFVNRTGKTATLWAGDAQKDLPDKSLVPVTFQQGPSSIVVQMVPKCSLDLGKHVSMTVTVEAARSGGTTPVTAPTTAPTDPTKPGSAPTTDTHPAPGSSRSGAKHSAEPTPGGSPTPKADHSKAAPGGAGSTTDPGDNDPFQAAPATANAAAPVFGSPVGPAAPRSASGLLTLIATVGVVGVSVAAIRAILGQRASRALAA